MEWLLAAAVCSAVVGDRAPAAIIGVELRTNAAWDDVATSLIGVDTHVVRMYAVFDGPAGPNDENVVLGTLDTDLSIIPPGAVFYQDAQGGDTAPDSGLFGSFPSLEWDTFVSIGRLDGAGGDDATFPLPDFGFGVDSVHGSWVNSFPPNLQGAPDAQFSVFLGQFGITGLPGEVDGAVGPDLVLYSEVFVGPLIVSHNSAGGPINTPILFVELVDCNGNDIPDDQDIAGGTSQDEDGNGIPDECEGCLCGDINSDGAVNLNDFASFVTCFGLGDPTELCDADRFACSDMNQDGVVNLADFVTFASIFGLPPQNLPPNCLDGL